MALTVRLSERELHKFREPAVGGLPAVAVVNPDGQNLFASGATVSTLSPSYSYYNQSSLASGYVFHGFANPNSNPTTANFRVMRETLVTGELLYGSGNSNFIHTWSAASLASISYL